MIDVGDLVICISNDFLVTRNPFVCAALRRHGVCLPEVHFVYTVRDVHDDGFGELFILLHELRNPVLPTFGGVREPAFTALAFRKIEKRDDEARVERRETVDA